MALKTQLNYISQDKSGRVITLADATGFESTGTSTGYGPPINPDNTDIIAYYLTFGKIYSEEIFTIKIDDTDPTIPTIADISIGTPFEIRSSLFDETGANDIASRMFYDGVLDLNMYVCFQGYTGETIVQGDNFIQGTDFTNALAGDAIVVNDEIYQIDKSKDDQGGTILWIIGEFAEDATAFDILYRSNIKALLYSVGDNMHQYACKKLQCNSHTSEWNNITVGLAYREAAVGFFNDTPPDYATANSLLEARYKLLNRYMSC